MSFFFIANINAQNADFSVVGNPDIKVPAFDTDASTAATWTALTASPHAVSRSCCVYISRNDTGWIYQFGGGATTQLTNVARYNLRTSTWTNSVSVMPFAISAGAAIADGDSVIYVFGGNNPTLGKTMKYNIVSNTWTTLTDMPTPATDFLAVKYKDTLVYVICGGDGLFGTVVNNAVRLFRMRSGTWTSLATFPVAKGMVAGGIYRDTIILAGGWNGTTGNNATHKGVINPSDPTSVTWTAVANYPTGGVTRMASYTCVIPGQGAGVAFTGGAIDGATLTAATNFYNFCTGTWQTLPLNPLARSNFRGAGAGDSSMYVVGGFTTVGVGNFERLSFSQIDGNCAGSPPPSGGQITICRTGIRKSIPENGGNANPALDTITVTGIPSNQVITKIQVKIDTVLHTWIGDLRFWLTKDAVTDTIISRIGWTGTGFGNSCDNFYGTNLVDSTGLTNIQNIPSTCNGTLAQATGFFNPKSPLAPFVGTSPNGNYILRICDNAAGDTGSLRNWCLIITYATATGISNNTINTIPGEFSLSQNYPNPFNPSTTINYSIPTTGLVTLKVYDVIGKEVATIVNEVKNAGNHEVRFTPSGLSSGVYFYRLQSGNFVETRKMFLMK